MNMRPIGTLLLAVLAAGCYESSSGRSDAPGDPASDPAPDPVPDHADSLPDFIDEPPVDYPPEVWPDCQASSGVTVSYEIDPSYIDFDREAACTIVSFRFNDEQTDIFLDLECMAPDGSTERWSISIHSSVGIPLYLMEGQEVVLAVSRYRGMMYVDGWFALYTSERQLLLAGLMAESLSPFGTVPAQWYLPLDLSESGGHCPREPETCYDIEPIALNVTSEGMTARIFDGNTGLVGLWQVYLVVVETAEIYHDMRCTDLAPKWFQAVIAALPSM